MSNICTSCRQFVKKPGTLCTKCKKKKRFCALNSKSSLKKTRLDDGTIEDTVGGGNDHHPVCRQRVESQRSRNPIIVETVLSDTSDSEDCDDTETSFGGPRYQTRFQTRKLRGNEPSQRAELQDDSSSKSDCTANSGRSVRTTSSRSTGTADTLLDDNGGDSGTSHSPGIVVANGYLSLSACINCGRQECENTLTFPYEMKLRPTNVIMWKEMKRASRKFCNIQFDQYSSTTASQTYVCEDCYNYLKHDLDYNKPEWIWFAFIWKLLCDPGLCITSWHLVPDIWRFWWVESMKLRYSLYVFAHDINGEAQFYDVSHELELDLAALDSLRWAEDLMPREESLILPTVKCPAGCSEWKHKTNTIPMDIVWEGILGVQIPLYSDRKYSACCTMFRNDYLMPDPWLYNPKLTWAAKASLARVPTEGGVPKVLCCRYHSQSSKGMMIHPCRNPTGVIATPQSNQFAPAVSVPRTIQKAQAKAYSASFQMVSLQGSYYGLDTLYLTTNGGFYYYQSKLAWKQDVLTVAGRKDMKANIHKMIHDKRISETLSEAFDEGRQRLYPDFGEIRQKFGKGGTYISTDDSVKLDQSIRFQGTETAIYPPDDIGRIRTVSFMGAWPKTLFFVHGFGDRYGASFNKITDFANVADVDTRGPWLLAGMLSAIPELWSQVASVQKYTDNWEGWFLTHVAREMLPNSGFKVNHSNPFGCAVSQGTLFSKKFAPQNTKRYSHIDLLQKFSYTNSPYDCMNVQINSLTFGGEAANKDIIIVLHDQETATTWSPITYTILPADWELRFVALTESQDESKPNAWSGEIFCRHGKQSHPYWWKHKRKTALPSRMPIGWQPSHLTNRTCTYWNVAVFVRNKPMLKEHQQRHVLGACGGQTKAYCSTHDFPMICDARKIKARSVCKCGAEALPPLSMSDSDNTILRLNEQQCTNRCKFICPEPNCGSAICALHHSQIVETEQKFYVGTTSTDCYYSTHPHAQHPARTGTNGSDEELPDLRPGDEDSTVDNESVNTSSSISTTDTIDDGSTNNDTLLGLVVAMENDEDGHCAGNSFRVADNLIDDVFVTGQHGLQHDEGLFETDANAENIVIPTTHAGTRPIYCVVDTEPYASHATSNHVILNHYGSCLVRRNNAMHGTLKNRNFLQSIASTTPGESLPLLYPEGMLFPDIFYLDQPDGSTVGAIPAAALHDDLVLQHHGLCSLQDHYRSRLSNPGLLASANPKYHLFAFDSLVNLGMRGCDSRIILRRGFAEYQGSGGIKLSGKANPIFDTEQVDCRPIVNQLSAAIGLRSPTYFYTHTCSMKTHFGMKVIWDWLMSDELMEIICDGDTDLSDHELQHLRQCVIDSAAILLLRAWMEIMTVWIRYITDSPEKPLGVVDWFFFRFELQEAMANLPHLHSILWTKDDLNTEAGLEAALDRIRGFVADIVRREEREECIRNGMFPNDEAIDRLLEMLSTILPHEHLRRCFTVVKSEEGSEEVQYRCKVSNNYKLNPTPSQHSFIEVPVEHTQEAIYVMQQLGVCRGPPLTHQCGQPLIFDPLIPQLRATKHVPPAHGHEGIISPVPGNLIVRNPNTMNIQFCTGYFISRYLAKYCASIDAYNVIKITPPTNPTDPDVYRVDGTMQLNTKITGNRIAQQSKDGGTKNPKVKHARAVNITETYMLLFGYDAIITNIKYVLVPTQTFEERSSKRRRKPLDSFLSSDVKLKERFTQNIALSAVDTVPCHHIRQGHYKYEPQQRAAATLRAAHPRLTRRIKKFADWRQFTRQQIRKAEDEIQSPLSPDHVTIFSLRPPELRFVMHQAKYARWFLWTQIPSTAYRKQIEYCARLLDEHNTTRSAWIDAMCHRVYVRARALPEILQYIEDAPNCYFGKTPRMQSIVRRLTLDHFTKLHQSIELDQNTGNLGSTLSVDDKMKLEDMFNLFVAEPDAEFLPVPWYRSVRPTQPIRFLIHLLLSFGAFVDEYTLFSMASLRDSFIYAGLLDPGDPVKSANDLCRRYLLEQLMILPAGSLTFDKYCVAAYNTIHTFFVDDNYYCDEMPTVLYCRLAENTKAQMQEYKLSQKKKLVSNLLEKLGPVCGSNLPSLDECMAASVVDPLPWDVTSLTRAAAQPLESHEEQMKLLRLGKSLVDKYLTNTNEATKNLCAVGAGGVGKTTADQLILLYAIAKGLYGFCTALASERSQELAGEHINSFLCMPKNDVLSVAQIAERCIAALYRNPDKHEVVRTMDILMLDEAGNVPAEIIAILDIVLRYIRNSNRPFGGILIISTMDNLQIEPPQGKHPLMSSLFISTFVFFRLTQSVRAARDEVWQRIQAITRLPVHKLTPTIKEEFISLLIDNCSWEKDETHVPPNALFVYGKNKPIREQEKRLFKKLRTKNSIVFLVSKAEDQERTVEGKMKPASQATSDALDERIKEPQELFFFPRARYQITQNEKGKYSNAQLAMLFKMPTQEQLDKKQPVELLLSPPGSRYIPVDTDSEESLKCMGWTTGFVHVCRDTIHNTASGIRAKRQQYRLRHHIASTLHSVMGQTLAKLVTRVGRGRNSAYSLWLPSQVVVLLSRTCLAIDTTFISTDKRETAEILFEYLQRASAFRFYINYLLERLCTGTGGSSPQEPISIDHSKSIYRPRDVVLQSDNSGCVYILVSLADTRWTYIGECENMTKRLDEHNRGIGSVQSAPVSLRPWALLAYVVGFDGNEGKRKGFENRWIRHRQFLQEEAATRPNVATIVNLAKDVIAEFQEADGAVYNLRLIDCGSLAIYDDFLGD